MALPKPKRRCKKCHTVIGTVLKDVSKPGIGNFCSYHCFATFNKTKPSPVDEVDTSESPVTINRARFTKKFGSLVKLTKGEPLPKHINDRDSQYREFIRSFPCLVKGCRETPIHAHHMETGGMGTKGSDYSCIPLCHKHHTGGNQSIHNQGEINFRSIHKVDLTEAKESLLRAYVRLLLQ